MSHDAHDKLLADIVQDRADAARALDDALNPNEAAEVVLLEVPAADREGVSHEASHELTDILGDALEELVDLENADVGPIEFEGKEDFVRGETACLRGIDVLGSIDQIGQPLGRKLTAQTRAAGFVRRDLPGGKSYLTVATRPTRAFDHEGALSKTRLVAKNAKMVAQNLRNFQPTGRLRQVIGGGVTWNELVGFGAALDDIIGGHHLMMGFGAAFDDLIGGYGIVTDNLVGRPLSDNEKALLDAAGASGTPPSSYDPHDAFGDVLGAAPRRGRPVPKRLPTPAEIRTMARTLESDASKLSARADKHEKDVAKTRAKIQKYAAKGSVSAVTALKAAITKAISPGAPKTSVAPARSAAAMRMLPTAGVRRAVLGATPDPNNPGFNTDGSIDWSKNPDGTPTGFAPDGSPLPGTPPPPGYTPGTPPDATGGPVPGGYTPPEAGLSELPPGPPDYGVEPAPTVAPPLVPGEDFMPDPAPGQAVDDDTEYDSTRAPLPLGAVKYAGQKSLGWRSLGSKTRFTGSAARGNAAREAYANKVGGSGAGYTLERDGGWGVSGYQMGGGQEGIMDGWYLWWEGNTSGYQYKKDEAGGGLGDHYSPTLAERARRSQAFGWGPIVGNPQSDDWRHARLDVGTGTVFWFRDKAPPWATQAEDLDRYNKLLMERQAAVVAAKTRYLQAVAAAQEEKAAADKRAKEWAIEQERMQREQVRTAADIAQKQAQFEQQQQQQQAQLEMQQQQQQQQLEAAAQQFELEQAQQEQRLAFQQAQAETSAYQRWLESGGAQEQPTAPEEEEQLPAEPRNAREELESHASQMSDASEEDWA